MSIFQSFQTGLAIGQEQRKQRDIETARKGAADAYKAGNFEGATTGLMAAGLYDEADAYARAGDRTKAEARRTKYGDAFKSGSWTGLGEVAAGEGDFETAGLAQTQARGMTMQEWEDRDRAITEQKQGMEFLATSAANLRSLPLEARGQAAMDAIASSPFAKDPAVMQAVQQAAADGRITDDELTQFEQQMLTAAERLEAERWDKSFKREGDWRNEDVSFRNSQAGANKMRPATPRELARYGLPANAPYQVDGNGQLYLIDGADDFASGGNAQMQAVPGLPPPTMNTADLPAGVVGTYARSDEKALEAARNAAAESRSRATLTGQFVDKADGYWAQGQGFINDLGQALSMETSDLNRISSKLGPTARPEGSGSTSDRDMALYLQSTVNVNNTKGTNKDVAAMERGLAENDAAYSAWLQDYTAAYPQPGATRDAKRLWDQYVNAPENVLFTTDPKTGRVTVNEREDIMTWLEKKAAGKTDADGASEFDDPASIPEGATVEDETGKRFRKQNGQLVPVVSF